MYLDIILVHIIKTNIYTTLNSDSKRRGSSNSWRDVRENALAKNSQRRQTLQGPLIPPVIPPAYPAVGYTSVYTTHHDRERVINNGLSIR